jgi:hypothetical protein
MLKTEICGSTSDGKIASLPLMTRSLILGQYGRNIEKLWDCLKTAPEACRQVDTFSEHVTGAQSL